MQGEVAGLRGGTAGVQGEVAGLRGGTAGLQGGVAGLRGGAAAGLRRCVIHPCIAGFAEIQLIQHRPGAAHLPGKVGRDRLVPAVGIVDLHLADQARRPVAGNPAGAEIRIEKTVADQDGQAVLTLPERQVIGHIQGAMPGKAARKGDFPF